jgi:RES domain-containing protein
VRVWRICRERYAADPLSGRGGLVVSGRWATKGRRVVYTSGSLSLASLEFLVHVDRVLLPPDLVQVEVDVPDRIPASEIDVVPLPKGWRDHPAPTTLRAFGDAWLAGGTTAILRVPSAVIPEESNVLLNPDHPHANKFAVVSTRAFEYDRRLSG